jgi:hypothetical protein
MSDDPQAPVTFGEMIDACQGEAWRIEMVQHDLVAVGLRKTPHARLMRRAQVFDRVVLLLTLIRGDRVLLDRLRGKIEPRPLAGSTQGGRGASERRVLLPAPVKTGTNVPPSNQQQQEGRSESIPGADG